MSDYDAGRAKAVYSLDIAQFEQQIAKIKQLYQSLGTVKVPTIGSATSTNAVSAQVNQQKQLSTNLLATANAQARLVQAQNTGKNSIVGLQQAEQIYLNVLKQIPPNTVQATRALTNLTLTQNRLKGLAGGGGIALPRTLENFSTEALGQLRSSFLSIIGPAALVTTGLNAVRGAISGAVENTQAALQLRETKNALFAVAGDMRTYNTILNEARRQQVLFGGSLQENIDGLQGLAVVSKSTHAPLNDLIDLQKRLAVLNSAQGSSGALIALTEALGGGQVRSLSRRFNIPVDQLKDLADASKPIGERLAVVDQYLNKVGITSAAVAGKVDQDAVAFRHFSQEFGDFNIALGNKIASTFSASAEGLARLFGVINGNPEAIAKLQALPIFGGKGVVRPEDIDRARLSVASAAAQQSLGANQQFTGNIASARLGEQQSQAEALLTELNLISDKSGDMGRAATNAFLTTNQSADDYINTLKKLVAQNLKVAQSTNDSKDALLEELQKKIQDKKHTADLAELQAQLAADSKLAAQGLLGAGDQALLLASKYGIAKDAASDLIAEQDRLLSFGSKSTKDTGNLAALPKDSASAGLAALRSGSIRTGEEIAAAQKQIDEQKAREQDAQNALALEKAKTHGAKIAELQRQLAAEDDPVEKLGIQRDIVREQNALEDEKTRKVKSQTSELNKQATLQESIYDSINKQKHALLDIQEGEIKDRQERRKEDQEIAKAQRILADPRKARLQAAAQDAIALIEVQRQQRQLDLQDKAATAGASLSTRGTLLQSRQAGVGGTRPAVGTIPATVPVPGQAQAPAGSIVRLQLVDGALKLLAEGELPFIANGLLVELERTHSAGTGKAP